MSLLRSSLFGSSRALPDRSCTIATGRCGKQRQCSAGVVSPHMLMYNRSIRRLSQQTYNPYRPDPPQPPKSPRRVVIKNLKFGRIAEAASAGVETAKQTLAESTSTLRESSQVYNGSSDALPSSSGSSNGPNASYRTARQVPPLWWLAGSLTAIIAASVYLTSSERKTNPQAVATARSDEVRRCIALPCLDARSS